MEEYLKEERQEFLESVKKFRENKSPLTLGVWCCTKKQYDRLVKAFDMLGYKTIVGDAYSKRSVWNGNVVVFLDDGTYRGYNTSECATYNLKNFY